MESGIRAMARILKNYARFHQIDTLPAVSRRWAPSGDDNDPEQHARNVHAHARGIVSDIDRSISLTAPEILFGVIRGIMVAENGQPAETVSDEAVREGIRLEATA